MEFIQLNHYNADPGTSAEAINLLGGAPILYFAKVPLSPSLCGWDSLINLLQQFDLLKFINRLQLLSLEFLRSTWMGWRQ